MILLVDNYDSFTYNLAQYLGTFTEVKVLRNDDGPSMKRRKKLTGLSFHRVQVGQLMRVKWKP